MTKIELKSAINTIKKDLQYLKDSYELNDKEAKEELYKRYATRLHILKNEVETATREKIKTELQGD